MEMCAFWVKVPLFSFSYDHTFEIYTDSERLYLFGTDNSDAMREWVKSIAKVTTVPNQPLLMKALRDTQHPFHMNTQCGLFNWFKWQRV